MGQRIRDTYVHSNLCQLNLRFGPDGPIEEMISLRKEFKIFSERHSLDQSFGLLNIGPQQEWSQRTGWYDYLRKDLTKYPSDDRASRNAHDRIVAVLKRNLESRRPLPVYFTCHASSTNAGVIIEENAPLSFTNVKYLIISLPTIPADRRRLGRRKRR
jgi:hypothetical protein